MSTNSPLEERSPRATQARTTPARRIGVGPLRYTTAGVVGVIAVLYLLIGADAITVVEDQAASDPAPVFIAGGLFAVLAVLLLVTTARVNSSRGCCCRWSCWGCTWWWRASARPPTRLGDSG
jgi:hypothetical protein